MRVEHENISSSPPSLPLCSELLISRSLSVSQHPAWKIAKGFFFSPPSPRLYYLKKKEKKRKKQRHTARRTYLLLQSLYFLTDLECAPQVSCSNASSPNVFSYDVLNPRAANLSAVLHCSLGSLFLCVCVDEQRLKHSALTPAVSCLLDK